MGEMALGNGSCRIGFVERLYSAFAKQLVELESKLVDGGAEILKDKSIGDLAKTLDTLLSLDRKVAGDSKEQGSMDLDRLRHELMDRLGRLARGGRSRDAAADAE